MTGVSEDKGVVLQEGGVLLEHVLHQRVDLLASHTNLVIECLLLTAFFLELNKLVLLVENCLNTPLRYHTSNELLCLINLDAEEVAQLSKADVHIDARDDHDVVLDQGLVQN